MNKFLTLVFCLVVTATSGQKISALPVATDPDGSELVPVVQSGVTSQTTVGALFWNSGLATVHLGLNAMSGNSGSYCVGIGNASGASNTGDRVVEIGLNSGEQNTGTDVVGIGYSATHQNAGSYVVGIGTDASRSNTGQNVIGIGVHASYLNTGDDVIGIGNGSARENTGTDVFGIGLNSCYLNTGQTVIGFGIGASQTNSGNNVIGIGAGAGQENTGTHVVGIGRQAAYQNTLSNIFFLNLDNNVGDTTNSIIWASEVFNKTKFNSSVQINDGTQGEGFYLVSDANGVGAWKKKQYSFTTVSNSADFRYFQPFEFVTFDSNVDSVAFYFYNGVAGDLITVSLNVYSKSIITYPLANVVADKVPNSLSAWTTYTYIKNDDNLWILLSKSN